MTERKTPDRKFDNTSSDLSDAEILSFEAALMRDLDGLADGAPVASSDLMARVLADATAVQATFGAADVAEAPARALSVWAQIGAALGGWPAISGLATATVAGVWIGVSPPAQLSTQVSPLLELAGLTGVVSVQDDSDWLLEPGFGFGLDSLDLDVTTEG